MKKQFKKIVLPEDIKGIGKKGDIIYKEKKDPLSDLSFEKKFIGKDLDISILALSQYNLEDVGISPVVDRNDIIIGFIYDNDNDGYFKGQDISDFGLKQIKNFWVYEM